MRTPFFRKLQRYYTIFVLYIVNELYFRRVGTPAALEEGRKRLGEKIAQLKAFGTNPALRRLVPPCRRPEPGCAAYRAVHVRPAS